MVVLAEVYAAGRTGIDPPSKHLDRETCLGNYALNDMISLLACKMRSTCTGLGDTARLLHRIDREEEDVPLGLSNRNQN